jgi:hypothetical protein
MFQPFGCGFSDDSDRFPADDSSISLDFDFPDPFRDLDAPPERPIFPNTSPFEIHTLPAMRLPPRPPRRIGQTGPVFAPRAPIARPAPLFIGKIEVAAMEKFQPRSRARPIVPWTSSTESSVRSDRAFAELCQNPGVTLNPAALGFIPIYFWPNKEVAFADLVYDFFQRKNNVNSRFLHKLYNALRISTIAASWAELVGVEWEAPFVIRVNKGQFARLLGIKAVEGSLFHQQGNFTTHGFVELNREQVQMYCPNIDLSTVDFDNVRLLVHQPGIFVSSCGEQQLMAIQAQMGKR